jgi:hypothetical protein
MSDLTGIKLVGVPFAVWPATMQVMPGGVADIAFGRFFVGVRLSNGGTPAWPITNARLSPRSRRQLVNAGFVIDDAWSIADLQAFDQQMTGEFVVVPALAASASRMIFFKMDATLAIPGVHDFEIELRDPAAPTVTVVARGALRAAQTKFDSHTLSFVSKADKGTVTASLADASFDLEALRRSIARARALFPPGPTSAGSAASQLDRVRTQLSGFICGDNQDICAILSEINTFCAVPQPVNPPPVSPPPGGSASGLDGYAVFGDLAATLADRVNITGATGSNQSVKTGTDGVLTGDVLSGGDIVLADRETVTGALTAAGFVRKPNTTTTPGPIREHATFFPLTIPTRTVTVGTNDVAVPSGTKALLPGTFGNVTASTAGKATLTFVAGLYQMKSLSLSPDTTLSFDVSGGLIEIRVSTLLAFGDRTIFNVTGGSGASRIQFYSDESDEVRIGTDIPTFTGVVVVPKGTIHAFSRTTVHGSLLAKTVTIEPDVSVLQTAPLLGSGTSWLGIGASGLELIAYPTALDYTLDYKTGFFGQTGPLAFDGLAWKSLLANVNLVFNLVIGSALQASLGRTAGDLVVGSVKTAVLNATTTTPPAPPPTQAGSVDAAALTLVGNRALGSPPFAVLDAQTGEANTAAISAHDGRITWNGGFLKNTEISSLIAGAPSNPQGLQVYKSGAVTGVTRGLLSGIIPVFKRQDPTGALNFVNQLSIVPDSTFPAADGQVAGSGDSGALWIHVQTGKAIALGHATGTTGGSAVASRIEDVVTALKIVFA